MNGMPQHAKLPRRMAIQAGAVGLLGLGMNHIPALQALAAPTTGGRREPSAKSVIYIFLSGGLSQIDSFDMKPDAPDVIRGEFQPIATRTPGLQICEHLPMLAERSEMWALVRSMRHPYPLHSEGHLSMLTGRTTMPPGFDSSKPKPTDWPSIASAVAASTRPRNNLPPAVVLPETIIHRTGRTLPGQFGGEMGRHRDPMFLELSRYNANLYGAQPEYAFHHTTGREKMSEFNFQAPNLTLPPEMLGDRFARRLDFLKHLDTQRAQLDAHADIAAYDYQRQRAVSLLMDRKTQAAFDVSQAEPATLDRYGRNTFGWSCLLARQLIEAGVNLVQVNLGNNETWDTHGNAFPNLKDFLFPPTDRAISALLDDLRDRGLLDSTLIVMAGEMGRTPRVSGGAGGGVYKLPGRDHWGTQSVWLAGGGVRGGAVVGATDKQGGFPTASQQSPENLGATIYNALGIPREVPWYDAQRRPHFIYHGDPIPCMA